MIFYKTLIAATCVSLTLFSVSAGAALLGRLAATPGGTDYQAYYDTDADLTWLADANAAGAVTWVGADAQAAGLNIDGVTGWRLPTTMQPDTTCSDNTKGASQFFGTGCTGSEMGHLYNVDGITLAAPGLFSNVQSAYWSGTAFAPDTDQVWAFFFESGFQGFNAKNFDLSAWAVQSGDVSAIPVPAAVWLFGSGLLGLLGMARRKSANI